MSRPRVSYAPRPDATPAMERSALANVFRFVLDRGYAKEGGRLPNEGGPDDAKGGFENDSGATEIVLE